MRLIGLAVVLMLSLALAPLAAEAQQQAGKVYRIGFLGVATAALYERQIEALRLGLREHSYVEGRNVTIEFRWAEGRYDRLSGLAAELVRLNPDVIITHGGPGTLALKQATSTIPIVMAIIGNPVEVGAVASLARPGGNITGSSFLFQEVNAKRVDLLKAALPDLVRVGLLVNPENVTLKFIGLRAEEQIAQALNLTVQRLEVRRLEDLDAAFKIAKTQKAAVVVPDEALFSGGNAPKHIADLAARNQLPSIGYVTFAEAGGLIGYGVDWFAIWRRAAIYVNKILKGAKPADLPVEQPTKFELVINLKTAKALGLTIPQSLLLRADQVIE